jgi:integrase
VKAMTIEVTDILEILEQHNFPTHKQIETLEVVNYALCKKKYPQGTCGILERKIQILQQSFEVSEKENPNTCTEQSRSTANIKVRSVVIVELLKKWLETAGITKKITFHCFRHIFATLQLSNDTNIYLQCQQNVKIPMDSRTEEAGRVSARIAEILSEKCRRDKRK